MSITRLAFDSNDLLTIRSALQSQLTREQELYEKASSKADTASDAQERDFYAARALMATIEAGKTGVLLYRVDAAIVSLALSLVP